MELSLEKLYIAGPWFLVVNCSGVTNVYFLTWHQVSRFSLCIRFYGTCQSRLQWEKHFRLVPLNSMKYLASERTMSLVIRKPVL